MRSFDYIYRCLHIARYSMEGVILLQRQVTAASELLQSH